MTNWHTDRGLGMGPEPPHRRGAAPSRFSLALNRQNTAEAAKSFRGGWFQYEEGVSTQPRHGKLTNGLTQSCHEVPSPPPQTDFTLQSSVFLDIVLTSTIRVSLSGQAEVQTSDWQGQFQGSSGSKQDQASRGGCETTGGRAAERLQLSGREPVVSRAVNGQVKKCM